MRLRRGPPPRADRYELQRYLERLDRTTLRRRVADRIANVVLLCGLALVAAYAVLSLLWMT